MLADNETGNFFYNKCDPQFWNYQYNWLRLYNNRDLIFYPTHFAKAGLTQELSWAGNIERSFIVLIFIQLPYILRTWTKLFSYP